MATCVKCGKDVGFLGSLSFNKQTARCSACETVTREALGRFRHAFLAYCSDGILTPQEWANLQTGAANDRLHLQEALAFIRGDALNFLHRTLTFAAADGIITDEEERNFFSLQKLLAIPNDVAHPLLQRLAHLKYITNIRQGKLPTVTTRLRLESDEMCHLEIAAAYHKVNSKSTSLIHGQLIATSKKLHFLSQSGGSEMGWGSIMNINVQSGGVYLQLSKKSGNGFYGVPDPLLVEAVIDTLVRIAKRQVVGAKTNAASRHIPHDIRIQVWQRDQGKCTECGAQDYLEFDHIIPHSKGGANTVGNVQLLCRRCNLQKSDRI